ncbi:MAG: anion permease [Treponema sp.]|nr:anion permease [Treponema sp.]
MKYILSFIRSETVFCIATMCAIASAFFVHPSLNYISYIDWNTLFILFALMSVIAALRDCGVFDRMAYVLCGHIHKSRILCTVLIMLSFFSSMLITNDVALLTFVPFSLAILGTSTNGKTVLLTVILETIAANTGSMLTPLGNPQNLFLFSKMEAGIGQFMMMIMLYSAISFILLFLSIRLIPGMHLSVSGTAAQTDFTSAKEKPKENLLKLSGTAQELIYTALFILCLLCVLRIIPKWIAAASAFTVLMIINRKILKSVDYMLLLTFAAFFIFTGNIASIPSIKGFLENAVSGHEFEVSVLCSQVISNVPATLLLYPFAKDTQSLLIGVNVGGLGTLVASLASLISFKLYSSASKKIPLPSSRMYLTVFTVLNLIFLAILSGFFILL